MNKLIMKIAIGVFGLFMLVNGIVGLIVGKNTSHLRRQLGGRVVDGWPGYLLSSSDIAIGVGCILYLALLLFGKSQHVSLVIGFVGIALLLVGGIGSIFV